MSNSRTSLRDFIKEERYYHLKKLNLIIDQVEIIRKDSKLIIHFKAEELIFVEDIEDIKSMFYSVFENFLIDIKINYSSKSIDSFKFISDGINNLILSKISSSRTWVKDIKWSDNNQDLIMLLPNETTYFSINRNGFINKLRESIKDICSKNLRIEIEEEQTIIEEDYFEEIELEERKIIKDILSSTPEEEKKNISVKEDNYSFGKLITEEVMPIKDINLETGKAVIKGNIFQIESRKIRGNKLLIIFNISDKTNSITVKTFLTEKQGNELLDNIDEESYVMLMGDVTYDTYSKSVVVMLKSLMKIKEKIRTDKAENKRVELHLHSQMSSMDGITNIGKLISRASEWGHKAIAITDHGVVQAFPEAQMKAKQLGIKIIYGVEGYMVNDQKKIVTNFIEDRKANDFVVFDIETTGLSPKNDAITEIGAVKILDGKVVDTFSQLINPDRPIPENIIELTGITNEMVIGKPKIDQVIDSFMEFIGDSVLVAHNAVFDTGFIRESLNTKNIILKNPILDTLELARVVFPNLKSHRLNVLAKNLGVKLLNHHRAVDDAKATCDILLKILSNLNKKDVFTLNQINNLNRDNDSLQGETFHIVLLVKDQIGLKNLYKLISKSHLNYFYRRPRLPKSLIEQYKEGLIIGSACESGELYKAILNNKDANEIRDIVKFYDYLEIQPIENNAHLVRNNRVDGEEQLQNINKKIYKLGKNYGKKVVATGDVHFLDPEDEVYRRILMSGQGFSDADFQAPLYLKTTDEMIEEFSYLGEEGSREVVVTNTNLISDMVEEVEPIPSGTFTPVIEGADEELKNITYSKAYETYGNPLPAIVKNRLDKELNSIIKNGYAVLYIISQKLVWKSMEDGYLVGSRGSVGSSFAATMSGITEVNPLSPHYVCPSCKYSEFIKDNSFASGIDLPDKECPNCGHELNKDGQDIPFEVFLGFEGDKEPDIDLNFAGEYQAVAHKYTEELFGEGYVFRAGTIGTIAEKTAYGFVRKYFEEKEMDINPAETSRLIKGCTGIKRTSGQHPGGVMIVPDYKDIHDFTPIQYPANDKKSGVITTHFDYNSISGRILKLDILGHDVPSIIKMLEDITGIDPTKIPLDDKDTMDIFTSTKPLGISEKDINCPVGTLGIPEFGTKFVRQMLVETQPATFSELVRISGLSHGTDVWINNAQNLVKNNIAKLSEVISTREDIMLYLINAGMEKKRAFFIMERVRRGKGLAEEDEADMRKLNMPDWYIDSCQKIKYMFPKAHAAAYVMMSFRIAYFKVHYPEAFYATYFTTKVADFDSDLILKGIESVKSKIVELESLGNDATAKEKSTLSVLEVVLEMYSRGFKFETADLYKSDSNKFLIGDNGIIPPLTALNGLGEGVAKKIIEEREIAKFLSVEDLINRTNTSKTVIEVLTDHGCLESLPYSNQISLFSI